MLLCPAWPYSQAALVRLCWGLYAAWGAPLMEDVDGLGVHH